MSYPAMPTARRGPEPGRATIARGAVAGLAAWARGLASPYLLAAICIVLITLFLFPIAMSFLASLKTPAEAHATPPAYLPSVLSFANYLAIYDYQAGLPVYLFNSLGVAFLTIAGCLLIAVPAGYGLARFPVPGKEIVFLLLLSALMIPYQALLTPLYLMLTRVGLQNTLLGLALIHVMIQLPFSIYLMRHSFEAVPRELEEAAVMDGCGSFQALVRIFLPSVGPGLVTLALFAFITSWNEFIAALILMNRETQFTIPIMLVASRTGHYGMVDWGALQAGVILSILPCMAVYLLLQRYYVSGLMSGAVK